MIWMGLQRGEDVAMSLTDTLRSFAWNVAAAIGAAMITGCTGGSTPVDNSTAQGVEALPPSGIPADAKLVRGDELKRMLLGRALRPVERPLASGYIGTERFHRNGVWEHFALSKGHLGGPIFSRSIGWNSDGYCVRPNDAGPVCSKIWMSEKRIFVEQRYPEKEAYVFEAFLNDEMQGAPAW
jgi:hypothetical protein